MTDVDGEQVGQGGQGGQGQSKSDMLNGRVETKEW